MRALPPMLRHACLVALLVPAVAAAQAPSRPTPAQRLDQALAGYDDAAEALALTPGERDRTRDLRARAEALAASRAEAEHHRDLQRAAASTRRIAWIVRILRARVEAMRSEARAAEAGQAVTSLRAEVTSLRAERDRRSEALIAAQRSDAVSTRTLPAVEHDAGAVAPAGSDAGR